VEGSNLFAGTSGGGVFVSGDGGAAWTSANAGLSTADILTLAVSPSWTGGSTLYAGTRGNGVWRRSLSEMVTSVETPSARVPTQFSLSQNYPNPFNPRTSFRLKVPRLGGGQASLELVTIEIFDVMGRKVATLLKGVRTPGVYTVSWNATGLPSGVYFCRMQAGQFSAVKKAILLN
jgi:hypothetical protein